MSLSEIDIKIGCDGTESLENYQKISVNITLKQSKINEYNKNIQKQLNVKRTPVMLLEFVSNEPISPVHIINLLGQEFQLKQKEIGSRKIYYGDVKSQEKLLFLRKIQRVLHLLTQLNIDFNLQWLVFQLQKILLKNKPQIKDILNKSKMRGVLKMDEKAPETLKKCLISISPKFTQSPIFVLFQTFLGMDIKLNLQNLDFLEQQARDKLLSIFFSNTHNQEFFQLLKKNKKNEARLCLCLEKLIYLQISGSSELLGLISLFL